MLSGIGVHVCVHVIGITNLKACNNKQLNTSSRLLDTQEVAGSSPVPPSVNKKDHLFGGLFY